MFGSDYNTQDGTCVRDYIHVRDLADAHWKAYEHLCKNNVSDVFNLGTGQGYSVKELIESAQRVCGGRAIVKYQERREGDVPVLVADASKAYNFLAWTPRFSSLEFILKSALAFENAPTVQSEAGFLSHLHQRQ